VTTPLTAEQRAELRRLRELEERVTPAPWRAGNVDLDCIFVEATHADRMGPERVLLRMNQHFNGYDLDAQFIVAARNTLPALLDAADRAEELERERERLQAVILHVNNALIGHGILDVDHAIECHAENLPDTARALNAAIEKAHEPVNVLIHEWVFKEPSPEPDLFARSKAAEHRAEELEARVRVLEGLHGEALPHLWHSACPRETYERIAKELGK
jgi:hypothetical protein